MFVIPEPISPSSKWLVYNNSDRSKDRTYTIVICYSKTQVSTSKVILIDCLLNQSEITKHSKVQKSKRRLVMDIKSQIKPQKKSSTIELLCLS